jgi:hypothetical protein
VTWVTNFDTQISARWSGVASSADVTKLAAANGSFDIYSRIYTSRDSGQTWISNNVPKLEWESIACSADGMKLITIACPNGSGPCPGPIYTSIDGGNTWTSNTIPYQEWTGVACSADGNTLAAVTGGYFGYPGRVWISQTTPAPVLNISEGNSNVMLSWTIPSTNFILQQSASMSPANWTTVSNLPVVNLTNLQDEVEIPWSAAGFYRLKTP